MTETLFTTAAGQRLAYTRQGSGPALVIIHGIGGRKEDWFGVAQALAAHRTVLCMDLLGFGESGKDSPTLTIRMQAEAVAALLDAAGFVSAAVVGNSLGGWVAAVFATYHPKRVDKLVLIDAAGLKVTLSGPPPVNFAPDNVEDMRTLLRTVIESPFAHTTEFAAQALAGLRASGAAASLGKLFSGFADPASTDRPLDDVLPGVHAPALVLWGEQDRLFPAALADMVTAMLPAGARKELLPGAGHFPHIDNQADVVTALARFLG
jgi:pimeloyl-ACP methyl ester carboxylesterase